jgi:peroxiredoxin
MKIAFPITAKLPAFLILVSLLTPLTGRPCAAQSRTISDKPPIGKPAPEFELPDYNGKNIQLSKFRKKFVVLEWFSDECPFVKKHYNSGNMQALQKEYVKKGVVWLTICSSATNRPGFHTNDDHKAVLKGWNANMSDFLIDADGNVGRMYGSKNTPTMYVVAKDGTLIYEGAIDDRRDPDPESVKGANNYVRAALDEAMAGKPVTVGVTRAYG